MTTEHPRLRVASRGAPDRPYAHLQPIVEAELGWGNRARSPRWFQPDPAHDPSVWYFDLDQPFHVEELRAAFVFPDNVRLGVFAPGPRQPPRMSLGDGNRIGITAPCPRDWLPGEGFVPLPRADGELR
jgi:hypothetical protein